MQTTSHRTTTEAETASSPSREPVGFLDLPGASTARRDCWKQKVLVRVISPLRALGTRLDRALGILTYHAVADVVSEVDGLLCVSPERFHVQIDGLLRRGYEPWSLRKVLSCHRRGERIPRNVFVVAFDDGYENVYLNAWPVLRRHKVPATIFLATAYLDQEGPFPFDNTTTDIHGSRSSHRWRPLTSAQCDEMLGSGLVDLGSHTHSHYDFRHRPRQFRQDLELSLRMLQERFGVVEPSFSFPYGFAGPDLIHVVRHAGVQCGLTSDCRLITPRCDPYLWGRFGATEFDTPASLAARLDGWYSLARDVWRSARGRPRGAITT